MKTLINNNIEFTQIKDFKDYYISKCGKVLSTKRKLNVIMNPSENSQGYIQVHIRNSKGMKSKSVHRLVALAFIENPENKPQVTHISSIIKDNNVSNLKWCTIRKLPFKNKFGKDNPFSKKVNQYDLGNNFIKYWDSLADIQRELKITQSALSACCLGKTKTSGGFKWKYQNF